jgi:hypothetical protein
MHNSGYGVTPDRLHISIDVVEELWRKKREVASFHMIKENKGHVS